MPIRNSPGRKNLSAAARSRRSLGVASGTQQDLHQGTRGVVVVQSSIPNPVVIRPAWCRNVSTTFIHPGSAFRLFFSALMLVD